MATTGLYTHRTRNAGEIVRDTLYNPAHKNHQQNDVPNMAGAVADDVAGFQVTVDPAPGGNPVTVIDVASELEQYRFALMDIKTQLQGGVPPTFWYVPVDVPATAAVGRGARVSRLTSQHINENTATAISFTASRYDTGVTSPATDPFWVIGSPTRLTAKAAGLYEFVGDVKWDVSLTGALAVYIRLNGTKFIAISEWRHDGSANTTSLTVSAQYLLAANEYAELIVLHLAGPGGADVLTSEFGLELLNPTAVVPPPTQFTLTVAEVGTGSGTITSDVGGINCPGTCAAIYNDGDTVILTATPTVGGFVQWEGDVDPGDEFNNPLTVTMDQVRTINARFTAFTLTIVESGTGAGIVTSDIGSINCPGVCDDQYAPGDVVELTAFATVGSFIGWSGDLVSTTNPDTILMDADKTVIATFDMTGVLASLFVSAAITGTRFICPSSVGAISGTESQVQFKLPIDVTFVSLSVTMAAALAVGQTIDFRFRMAGVDDNTIVASLVAGEIEKQADGSIFVPADTLITIKSVQAGGVSNLLQSLTIVYRPAS